jgi:hypothetical protein
MGISDNGAYNTGLGNIASANYGPTAVAGQQNTAANTALTSQQAQQAGMQNQITRASMPLIMKALKDATEDQSASNPGSPSSKADQSGVGSSWNYSDHQDSIEDTLRQNNYVAPYTGREAQLLQASKSLGVADPARGKALFDSMNAQREMRISQQTAQNQLKMGNMYDTATAVATKGQGSLDALGAVDPQDAATIRKNYTDASGNFDADAADAAATQYAQHTAAVAHLYSGRPTDMQNGQLVDTKTGQAVTGRDQLFTGLDAKERQAEYDKAIEPVKYTTPDNVEHQELRWKAPIQYGGYGGKLTPAQAVLSADQAARHAPDGSAQPPGIIPNEAAAPVGNGNSGVLSPSHGAAAAARVNLKNTATPPTTGADIAAGNAPATANDIGTLPGINPAALPRMINPSANQGAGTGGTVGTALQTGVAERQNKEIEASKTASADAQVMRAQIIQARAEIPKIDPRTVGPGSTYYNNILKFYTGASGTAPDALVDEGVLDKFLNQIGASNVRNLLAGQRITNQEMMTFLTRGSPSTSMPLGGIKNLLDYLDADNEYTLRYNRTKMMGLKSGADPDLIDGALSNDQQGGVSRSSFVSKKTGSADALGGSGQTTTSTAPAGTQEGAKNTSKSGKPITFTNGHWQYD